ncbi:metabotropic glutamate receptor 2-like [Palaemon carinicauda]|uniref:metabotropic glutamate receptor 2-like n=1 Tax=Palaemon carinicauda TaxID=392227 RepID=UPI0035B689B0
MVLGNQSYYLLAVASFTCILGNLFHAVKPSSPLAPSSPVSPQLLLYDELYNMTTSHYSDPFRTKRLTKNSRMFSLVTNRTRPAKKVVVMEGDILLGGLMMVHERGNDEVCGPIMPQGGVQALEAMLYTLDYINDNEDFIPGVRIGAHILDDCDKDTYGLEQAVDFIKGSISNIDDGEYKCKDGSSPEVMNKVISGVVGAASSVTSIQVANLLRLFRIPQVSFFSTSPELSNKQRFEYFSRTIPSDHYQVKAMVEIVKMFNWSYISIIYEESNYGIKAFEELEGLLASNDICIAVKEKLVKDSGVAEEVAYDLIVKRLLQKQMARDTLFEEVSFGFMVDRSPDRLPCLTSLDSGSVCSCDVPVISVRPPNGKDSWHVRSTVRDV